MDGKTETALIESTFDTFIERKDIAIVLINQHVGCSPALNATVLLLTKRSNQVADKIRHRIDTYTAAFPTILEIPSKDHPYDPEKDSVLRRVRRLFGE